MAEISSAKLRGIVSSFTQLSLSVGILLIYLLGSFEGFHYYNSSLVLIGIVFVFEASMLFLYDTPRWLLAHKHRTNAISALRFLRGPRFEIGEELTEIETGIANSPHLRMSRVFSEFTKKKVLIPLVIVLFIMFFQQIGGLNASTAYSASIFKEAGVSNYRETATYAVGGVGVLFTIIAAFIVDFIGRKLLLIVSGVGMLIATVCLGTFFYVTRPSLCSNVTTVGILDLSSDSDAVVCNVHLAPLAIVSLMLFNAAFSIGWGPVPWILLGELIPLRVRGVGSGMATFVNWGTAAVVTGVYLDYAKAVQTWFAWWTFSIFNFAAIVFVILFIYETKGKSLEDIQNRYDSKHSK